MSDPRGLPGRGDWAELLELALPALDEALPDWRQWASAGKSPAWSLGGGTALALQIDHRLSFDIDIFLGSTRIESLLPRNNAAAARISPRYQWPGHYLKFERNEGEIDFLGPGLLTTPGIRPWEFRGATIPLETPEEIIAKKIRYRGANLKPRDIFDMAAVFERRPAAVRILAEAVPDMLTAANIIVTRSATRHGGAEAMVAAGIMPTERGRTILANAHAMASRGLSEAHRIAKGGASSAPSVESGHGTDMPRAMMPQSMSVPGSPAHAPTPGEPGKNDRDRSEDEGPGK